MSSNTDVQGKAGKLFTQNEVNAIVQERLNKERQKHTASNDGEFKELKEQLEKVSLELETLKTEYMAKHSELTKEKINNNILSLLQEQNIINPTDISNLFKGNAFFSDEGILMTTTKEGDTVPLKDHVKSWCDANPWAIKNTQKPGSGQGIGARMGRPIPDPLKKAFDLE